MYVGHYITSDLSRWLEKIEVAALQSYPLYRGSTVHTKYKCQGDPRGGRKRWKEQTSVWNIEPEPRDWQSSAPSTKPLPQPKVRLPISFLLYLCLHNTYT